MHESKSEPMLRDNKRLPLSDLSSVVPTFLLLIFIIIPIWLTILLPITLFYQLIKFIYKKCTMMLTTTTTVRKSTDPRVSSSRSGISNHGHIQQNEMYQNKEYKSSSSNENFSTKHPSSSPSSSPTTIKTTFPSVDHSTRPCDIIIYGATGFTGYSSSSPTLSSS